MTRPVSYACEPAARYCECGHCQLPPARNDDLEALAKANRDFSAAAYFIILLFAILAFMAIGFANTEEIHRKIVAERAV